MTIEEAITNLKIIRVAYVEAITVEQARLIDETFDIAIEALKAMQRRESSWEWCSDCKEYDQEKHHCPRWCKIIRQTVQTLEELNLPDREKVESKN